MIILFKFNMIILFNQGILADDIIQHDNNNQQTKLSYNSCSKSPDVPPLFPSFVGIERYLPTDDTTLVVPFLFGPNNLLLC